MFSGLLMTSFTKSVSTGRKIHRLSHGAVFKLKARNAMRKIAVIAAVCVVLVSCGSIPREYGSLVGTWKVMVSLSQ